MKKIAILLTISLFILFFNKTATAQNNWTFFMFETTVTREGVLTSDENPAERRFYFSNVIEIPNNIRSYQMPKIADDYFMANIVEPLRAKGIKHQYYESDVDMDCGSVVAAKDKKDAEGKLANCIEEVKERGRVSIYSFYWSLEGLNSLETAIPQLIFRGKETPNYQPKEGAIPEAVNPPTVKKNNKINKGKRNKNIENSGKQISEINLTY